MTTPTALHSSSRPTSQAGTWETISLGQITTDSGHAAPRSYNCDACAASLPAPVMISPTVDRVLQVHAQLITSELGNGNLAVYSPLSQSGVVVLSGSMRAVLAAYSTPGTLADARQRLAGLAGPQLEEAVTVLARCGILCEPAA
jgi:hypothetical protein